MKMLLLSTYFFTLLLGLSLSHGYSTHEYSPPEGECNNFGRNPPQSSYHAPRRVVTPPSVDAEIKRQFLLLFHKNQNETYTPRQGQLQLPQNALEQINNLCPREGFFYSFAPRHFNATQTLQAYFMRQTSPAAVLELAKSILKSKQVNRRVWYYALLGAITMRPDMNGYYLAWAPEATPDLYLTASVVNEATKGSSRPKPNPPAISCNGGGGAVGGNRNKTQQQQWSRPSVFSQATPPKRRTRSSEHLQGGNKREKRQSIGSIFYPEDNYGNPQEINKRPGGSYNNRGGSNNNNRGSGNNSGRDNCVLYKGTNGATDSAENRLWYFREDVMINEHHWYWHQYFPQVSTRHPDRRGEVFYFAHHNIIARNNAERMANGLDREIALDIKAGTNIGTGYNADIVDMQSGRPWTPRQANIRLSDLRHGNDPDFQLEATMDEMSSLYRLLVSHIAQGYLMSNKSNQNVPVNITNPEGLSHLGNTLEASEQLSLHTGLYHTYGIHNLAHIAVALSTDPDYASCKPPGVMGDLTVTLRDPTFFKVHTLVDELFDGYKKTLPPYQLHDSEWPLVWSGVQIQTAEMVVGRKTNYIKTFWSTHKFPLEEGIDGSIHDGDVNSQICHQHLNHEPFQFKLVIDVNNCMQSVSKKGTVRIFLAPRYDRRGKRFPMSDTRKLMFQLDAFPVDLRQGRNIITRNSVDSSSTKPWSRTLQDMLRDPSNGGQTEFCGCGWPQHLYMPKGTPQGMEFDLFAMITNYDQDHVPVTAQEKKTSEPCHSPYLFCGIPFRKYPDARPMGYPFDRLPYSVQGGRGTGKRQVANLEEYVDSVPNMYTCVVTVEHSDKLVA